MKKACFALIFSMFTILTAIAQPMVWEKMHNESEGGWAEDIVVVGNKIWMSHSNELFVSANNGVRWSYVLTTESQGIQYGGTVNYFFGSDKKIIVSGDSIFFGNQYSPDRGTTWSTWTMSNQTLPINHYFAPTVMNIHKKKLYMGSYYSGFFRSADLGENFSYMNTDLPSMYGNYEGARALEFYNDQPVIATISGLHRWNGNNWVHPAGNGLPSTTINSTTCYLVDRIRFLNSKWIASTNFGVYFSNDHGANWQRYTDIPEITGLSPWDLYSAPAVFYNLDVSEGKIFACYESDIFISADGGATWKYSPLPDRVETKRVVSINSIFLVATSGGVYRSTDSGTTWQKSNKGFERTYYLGIHGKYGEGFLASTGSGILKSSMRGKVLTPFNEGMDLLKFVRINAILPNEVFSTQVKYYAYGGTSQKWDYNLYQSDGSAPQWDSIGNIPVDIITSMHVSSNGSFVITGPIALPSGNNDITGIHLSEDHGQTWNRKFTNVTHNTLQEDYVTNILFEDDTLYVGTTCSGIYKSWDQGNSWTPINNGLNLPITTDSAWWDNASALVDITTIKKFGNDLYMIGENYFYEAYSALHYSSDGGKNWTKRDLLSLGPDFDKAIISSLIVSETGDLYARAYRDDYTISSIILSHDKGVTWEALGPDFPDGYVYAFDLLGDYLYASGKTGLWRLTSSPETITSVFDEELVSQLSAFPNPFTEHVNVTLQTSDAHRSRVEIFSSDGRKILDGEHFFEPGNDFVWNGKDDYATSVQPGLYIVRVTYGGKVVRKKLIKHN